MTRLALRTGTCVSAIALAVSASAQGNGAPGATVSTENDNTVIPFYGNIDPFYGDIDPFYGDIDAFWDDIHPFYGDIDAFWDDIHPFYGDIDAFWGDIVAFRDKDAEALGEFWEKSGSQIARVEELFQSISYNARGRIVRDGTPNRMMAALKDLIEQGRTQFGADIEAQTGQAFDAWVHELFARHGARPYDKASVEVLTASQRARLYLDWHDSLMQFSGIDQVDHWMATVNWMPMVTQIQGQGGNTIVGIMDADVTRSTDLVDNVIQVTGQDAFVRGHGAGVASLIAGAHDGEGVMGIAPNARLVAHNPFDHTDTANWDDVQAGIIHLVRADASIVNMSLGEPGQVLAQNWRSVFTDTAVARYEASTAYVMAAGNDGIAQHSDIDWTGAFGTSFIVVGSVSPSLEISSFSNRPGTACLLDSGVCSEGDRLMDRFIVAPGELLLVDDGFGGIARRSGTSFSAPLVSGAIALLHERWPWLARDAAASTEIILRSARDLGAPGTDAIYGVGMLDVVASQSPLNFNDLSFTFHQRQGRRYKSYNVSAATLLAIGIPEWWETRDAFLTMFEEVGGTWRDFAVPMSSFTYGKRTNALGGGYLRLQDFVSKRFTRWVESGGRNESGGEPGFSELSHGVERAAGTWTVKYSAVAPRLDDDGSVRSVHNAVTLTEPSGRVAFTAGHGYGSLSMTGGRFGVVSDHDRETGGVNPVLGLASGEAFGALSLQATPTTTMRLGFSANRLTPQERYGNDLASRAMTADLADQLGSALAIDIEQRLSDAASVNVQYTRLSEANALLGVQAGQAMLGEGSATSAMTLSGTVRVSPTLRMDVSATAARTRLADGQLLHNAGDITSSAAQIALTGSQVFTANDSLRVSFGQPLTVESGTLALVSDTIVDRSTGERGQQTHNIDIATKRRLTGEVVYAAPLGKRADLGLFGRFVTEGDAQDVGAVMAGVNVDFRF